MIELSLGGLIGAILGTMAAAFAYAPLVGAIERALQPREGEEQHQPTMSGGERTMLRRGLFTLNLGIFAGVGYWLGDKFVG